MGPAMGARMLGWSELAPALEKLLASQRCWKRKHNMNTHVNCYCDRLNEELQGPKWGGLALSAPMFLATVWP